MVLGPGTGDTHLPGYLGVAPALPQLLHNLPLAGGKDIRIGRAASFSPHGEKLAQMFPNYTSHPQIQLAYPRRQVCDRNPRPIGASAWPLAPRRQGLPTQKPFPVPRSHSDEYPTKGGTCALGKASGYTYALIRYRWARSRCGAPWGRLQSHRAGDSLYWPKKRSA